MAGGEAFVPCAFVTWEFGSGQRVRPRTPLTLLNRSSGRWRVMLAFAFAFAAGFVNTAAVLHAPSAGLLQLGERSPLTARHSHTA